MPISGTPLKLLLDGESFDFICDADFTMIPSKYEKESMPTSGDPIIKFKSRTKDVEGEVSCSPAKLESLISKADSLADITVSFTVADGSTYKGQGHLNLDPHSYQDGKIKIKIIPSKKDGWTYFAA